MIYDIYIMVNPSGMRRGRRKSFRISNCEISYFGFIGSRKGKDSGKVEWLADGAQLEKSIRQAETMVTPEDITVLDCAGQDPEQRLFVNRREKVPHVELQTPRCTLPVRRSPSEKGGSPSPFQWRARKS